MRTRTPGTRIARRVALVALVAAAPAAIACTSSPATAPGPTPEAMAAGIHLAELSDGEQVVDARPAGDGRAGWALTDRRVLRTSDDGDNWTEVVGPWRRSPVLAGFSSPDDALFVEAAADGQVVVHRTTDTGRTFASTAVATTTGSKPRWLDVADPRHATLVVGPDATDRPPLDILIPHRILTTDDGGATWTDLTPTAALDRAWIAADGTGYAIGTGPDRGLYRLAGRNLPWQRLAPPGDEETGPGGGPSYRIVEQRDRRVVAESHLATGMQVRYRLLASDDAGRTWREIDGLPTSYMGTGTVTSTAELGPAHLVTAAQSIDIGIVVLDSGDDGRTWQTHPTGSCASGIGLRVAPPRRIWIYGDLSACEGGARDGATCITRSTDGGTTWTRTDPTGQHTKPR